MIILHKDKVKIRQGKLQITTYPTNYIQTETIAIIYSFTKKSGGKCLVVHLSYISRPMLCNIDEIC